MFCYNCGKDLASFENISFCPFCGTKFKSIISDNSEKENDECVKNHTKTQAEMKSPHDNSQVTDKLYLYGCQIETGTVREIYSSLTATYYKLAIDGYDRMIRAFKNKNDAPHVVRTIESDYKYILSETVNVSMKIFESLGIHDCDEDKFIREYLLVVENFSEAFYDFVDEYNSIVNDAKIAREFIQNKKDGRSKFVGGGFGLSGAVKGMMMAGAANAVSGTFASISASMDIAKADKRYHEQLSMLCSNQNAKKFADSVQRDVFAALQIIEKYIIYSKGETYRNPFSSKMCEKADSIFKRVCNNEFYEDEAKMHLVLALSNKPYDTEFVRYAFERFGDDNGNLTAFVKKFGNLFDIEDEKNKLADKQKREKRMLDILGNDYNWIRKRFLQNNIYGDVLIEKLGEDFFSLYRELLNKMPQKILDFSYRYCWETKYKINRELLDTCNVDADGNNIPVFAIDFRKDIFGKGCFVFTTKGVYSNTVKYTWEHLKTNVYTDKDRCINMKRFSIPSDYENDVFDIIEVFYVVFALTNDFYNNKTFLQYENDIKNSFTCEELVNLSEKEFLEKIKVLIENKTTYDFSSMFVFDENNGNIELLLKRCPNYRKKNFALAFVLPSSYSSANKGIVFTNRGCYIAQKDREELSYIPYSKMNSISVIKSGSEEKIVLIGKDISEKSIINTVGFTNQLAGIFELIIKFYKSPAMRDSAFDLKSKGQIEELREISDLIYEELISEKAQKIWWSQNVCENRISYARDTSDYALIEMDHEAYRLTGDINKWFVTKIIFALALFISFSEKKQGKEGIVFTEKGVYIGSRSLYNKKVFFEYYKIDDISVSKKSNGMFSLEINDVSLSISSQMSEKDAELIGWLMKYIVNVLSGKKVPFDIPYKFTNNKFNAQFISYVLDEEKTNTKVQLQKIQDTKKQDVDTPKSKTTSLGNHISKGIVAEIDGKLFYGSKIHSALVVRFGTEVKRFYRNPMYLFEYNGALYMNYEGNYIGKFNPETAEITCVYKNNCTDLHNCNGTFAFVNMKDKERLYLIESDGSNVRKVVNDKVTNITITDDWIYYLNLSDKSSIYRVRRDGTERTKLFDEMKCSDLTYDGTHLYFRSNNFKTLNELYRIPINGGDAYRVFSSVDCYIVTDTTIFMSRDDGVIFINKNNIDTAKYFIKGMKATNLCVLNGYLYFNSPGAKFGDNYLTHRVDCEGGKIETL